MKQGVLGIIFNKDRSEVLLIKRRDVPVWVLPGGGVDAGETPESAVIREIKEETGLLVSVTHKVAEYTPVNKLTCFVHLYSCEKVNGTLEKTPETYDARYFTLDKLPVSFFHVHKDFIQDALTNNLQVLKKPLHQVTYLKLFKYFIKHPLRVLRFSFSWLGFPLNSE